MSLERHLPTRGRRAGRRAEAPPGAGRASRRSRRSRSPDSDRYAALRGLAFRTAVLEGGRGRRRRGAGGPSPEDPVAGGRASGCTRSARSGHVAPAPDCECGVHAWHPRRSSARDVLAARGTVAGHRRGAGRGRGARGRLPRGARAAVRARSSRRGSNAAQIRRLADRYDARSPRSAGRASCSPSAASTHIGMEEDVVAELLGTGDSAASAGAPDSARTRCASSPRCSWRACSSAGGLAITSKPSPGTKLYGRTGEIRTH